MQSDWDAVAQWISSSGLCLNVVKSSTMLTGSQPRISGRTLNVSIGGTVLNLAKSVRYLGVIDSSLSWSLNITSVVSRVRSRISSVLRYGTSPPLVLCLLYSTYVLPLFDYCDVVWTPITAKLTASLERVHS